MKRASILSIAILSIASAAHAEGAASLTGISGPVLVNTGEGFLPASGQEAIELKAGDRVLVRDDAMATVAYAECAVTISKPSLFTVTKDAPCAKGASLPQDATLIRPASAETDRLQAEARVVSTILTGAMVIGSAAVLINGLSDDEDDPASPN